LLRGAEGAGPQHGGSGGGGRAAGRAPGAPDVSDVTLLRRPGVFTLAVGWESVQARCLEGVACRALCRHVGPP